MEASAKLDLDKHTKNEDWTVVLPRRGKKWISSRTNSTPEAKQQSWVPAELESDLDRELKLIQKMGICIKKVESSQFYQNFLEQVENLDILNSFSQSSGLETEDADGDIWNW